MLKQENNGRDRELTGQGAQKSGVNHGGTDMLETAGNSLQNFDGVFARFALAVTAIQVRCQGEDDNDKGITEHRDEEE